MSDLWHSSFNLSRDNLRLWYISLFLFLGPLGSLLHIPGTPNSFRFYYFIMPFGVGLFILCGISRKALQTVVLLLPILLYTFWRSWDYYVHIQAPPLYANPFVRWGLFANYLLLVPLLAGYLAQASARTLIRLLDIYLLGFLLSMIAGYLLFVGYYAGVLSKDFINYFQVLTQYGYGLLRFSPGSYPNEYGTVAAFNLSLLLMRLFILGSQGKRVEGWLPNNRWVITMLLIFTLVALFLTTTRSAYLAAALCVIYIVLIQPTAIKQIKNAIKVFACSGILLVIAQQFYDVFGLLETAYSSAIGRQKSVKVRLDSFERALDTFNESPIWGHGFGNLEIDLLHNVYLQLLCNLGLVGLGMLILSVIAILVLCRNPQGKDVEPEFQAEESYVRHATWLALFSMLFFGMSNHNMNHHLTWLAILLGLVMLYRGRRGWRSPTK